MEVPLLHAIDPNGSRTHIGDRPFSSHTFPLEMFPCAGLSPGPEPKESAHSREYPSDSREDDRQYPPARLLLNAIVLRIIWKIGKTEWFPLDQLISGFGSNLSGAIYQSLRCQKPEDDLVGWRTISPSGTGG